MFLQGKVALVTGSTSGIGLAIAKAMAAEGAKLMINGFGDPADIARECAELGALHDGASGPRHAILLQQDGLTDLTASLNDPSWNLVAATAINEQGQIAGCGYKDGHRAAFLLTPGH